MSAGRTLEISDPRFASDGLRFLTVKSPALGGRADLTLFAPDSSAGRHDLPLLILLHGVYGSHWGWALRGGAHQTLRAMIADGCVPPIVLAMPSDGLWGDGSCYVRHSKQDFERWIVDEVPAAVRDAALGVSERSPMAISGLSMGGFGALRLAAKHPDRFCAVSGHSSVTHVDQLRPFVEEDLGTVVAKEDRSVLETLLRHRATLPALRFDCGTEDSLLEANRELHRNLEQQGIPHTYEEFPGGHEWPYWEEHLKDTLRFFASRL